MSKKRMNNSQINEAFNNLIAEFEKFKNSFESLKDQVNSKIENTISDFQSEKSEINSFKEQQQKEISEFKLSQEKKLREIIDNIESKKKQIDEYNNELFNEENGIEHKINLLKEEIENYYSELLDNNGDKYSIKEKISDTFKEILKYKKELFGYKEKDENGKIIAHSGIKDEIESLVKKYNEEINKFLIDTDKLLKEKENEMNELLSKMNLNYNAVEKEALSKKYFELSSAKEKSVKNSIRLISAYSILLTIALMFLFTNSELKNLFNKENVIAGAIIRIAITTPLMYLIIIASNKLRREIAIRDQYNYKGLLMSTYRNISTHLNNSSIKKAEEKQVQLLDKVFNQILENEADKQDKSDNYSFKHLSSIANRLAKDLNTDKKTLISILPEIIEKFRNPNQNINNNSKINE